MNELNISLGLAPTTRKLLKVWFADEQTCGPEKEVEDNQDGWCIECRFFCSERWFCKKRQKDTTVDGNCLYFKEG